MLTPRGVPGILVDFSPTRLAKCSATDGSSCTMSTSSDNQAGQSRLDSDGNHDGAASQPSQQPPAGLDTSKLRGDSRTIGKKKLDDGAVMSPTTSVKALLADTNAAPPPASSQVSSSVQGSTAVSFEQQQAALRRRKAGGAESTSGEQDDGPVKKLGADDSTLIEDPNSKPRPKAPLIDGRNQVVASGRGGDAARPTFQQTLQDLRQFLFHFLKILPFKGLQKYLKKIIGPVVRLFVRGVAKILHRGQFGLASNLAFDIHLLLWKVSHSCVFSRSWSSGLRLLIPFSVGHQSVLPRDPSKRSIQNTSRWSPPARRGTSSQSGRHSSLYPFKMLAVDVLGLISTIRSSLIPSSS